MPKNAILYINHIDCVCRAILRFPPGGNARRAGAARNLYGKVVRVMNAKGDANRSVRMTKQRLYQALIQLLQEKELREITVRELTELAGISRGTFYFHYADIYALMDQMEAAQLDHLCELMDALVPSISQEDVPPALVTLFEYLYENRDVCRALYGKSWESDFTRSAKEVICRRCMGCLVPDGASLRQQYLMTFAVNGCFGCIAAWQAQGYRPAPEEMAVITWQATRAVKDKL